MSKEEIIKDLNFIKWKYFERTPAYTTSENYTYERNAINAAINLIDNIQNELNNYKNLYNTADEVSDRLYKENQELKENYNELMSEYHQRVQEKCDLEKENEELKQDILRLDEKIQLTKNSVVITNLDILNDYTLEQKIKDKIEELESYKGLVMYEKHNYEEIIRILQKLLKEEK